MKLQCPGCHSLETSVKDARPAPDNKTVRRRRECPQCGLRFTTLERICLDKDRTVFPTMAEVVAAKVRAEYIGTIAALEAQNTHLRAELDILASGGAQ